VTEYPVFLPFNEGVLSAVVTLPEGEARGAVVNVTGTVLTSNFGSYLCSRLAEPLAEQGIASIRFDFSGAGDSPGTIEGVGLDSIDWALDCANTALRNIQELASVERFAAVGTCYGTRIVFRLLRNPLCVGAVCLAPVLLETRAWSRMRTRYHKRSVIALIKSNRVLRFVVLKPVKFLVGERRPATLVLDAVNQLSHARLRLIVSHFLRDHYSPPALKGLEEARAKLPADEQRRLDVQIVNDGPLSTFEFMPREAQNRTVASVVESLVASFDEAEARVGAAVAVVLG
jgi:alpha/beta superfamily hydrolase